MSSSARTSSFASFARPSLPLPRHVPVLLAIAAALPAAAPARAQRCDSVVTRTAPGPLSGLRIDSLSIVTLAPDPLPGPASVVDGIHVRTQDGVIRRQLLFVPGDTVDTVRVAESMRRLRSRGYLSDAWLQARPCRSDGGVSLTLVTRDAWSTRPALRMGSSGGTLGLEERNLFGTARAASIYLRADGSRVGVGAMLSDPWVPGTNLAARVSMDSYRDGGEWSGRVETRRLSIFDPWRVELSLLGSTTHTTGDTANTFTREGGALLVSRAAFASASGVTSLLGGAEVSRSRLLAPAAALVGPPMVLRRFAGLDAGVRRETARYDTLSWLLAGRSLADVPLGLEWDAVVGVGREYVTGTPMAHLDAWGGRVWVPGAGRLLVTDFWASGFFGRGSWEAGTLRALVSYYASAPHGGWQARFGAERLLAPDPDVRALSTTDPTLPLYPRDTRLAESAIAASVERQIRVRPLSNVYEIEAALFAAGSLRGDPAATNNDQLYAGVAGVGLRLAPLCSGRATLRLDLGFPVVRSPGLRRSPYVAILLSPWLGAARERLGLLRH